ncbi:MAG TPA: isocitrate lyase/PEP mutase family protein [Trebonia sp.]|nr:isocitrate lyase/PEP mutase family protein [Trebonia sp.]
MTTSPSAELRNRVFGGSGPLLLPGAPDALTARMLEDLGAEAVYVSGAGISNTYLGMPDVGLLTLTELVSHVSAMRDAVELPLVVDSDTGFGNAMNVRRTIRALERAGASAIQLEDQVMPKRCGHFVGKSVVAAEEMVQKIFAATDSRTDDNLLIIARTDARAEHGLAEACARARAYLAAGADIVFVEAPQTVAELREIPRLVPGPHIVNMVEGGRTPILPLAELTELGFSVILYANAVMRGGLLGMRRVAEHLLDKGDTIDVQDQMVTWSERQGLVRKDAMDELEDSYAARASRVTQTVYGRDPAVVQPS